ncbi:MAG: T9SS type A sorting domain-containing protein [Candidatus Eisenbacteria bacterium]
MDRFRVSIPAVAVFFVVALGLAGVAASAAGGVPVPEPGWPVATAYSVSQSAVAAQLDADPELEIVISSQDRYLYVFEHDGSIAPGWPRFLGDALGPDEWVNQCSSPAVADLDDDGTPELIAGNFDGKLHVFEPDGSVRPGFPFQTGWMIFSTPAIGDIDGDGHPEIVFGSNDGGIYALRGNGTLCPGFPYHTPYVVRSSPALGDLDGDGIAEIVCTADNSDYQLYAIRGDGTNLPGFPKVLWQSGAISSPALGDIDADGDLDIVAGARDGSIHVLDGAGAYLPGWPLDAGYSCESSPTLANLDGDAGLEIVVGMNDSQVCAFEPDGSPLPGWPRPTSYTVKSSASIGDVDADGAPEIVIGENTGKVYGWNVDGSSLPGFPITDPTYTIYSSPLLEDLDRDGSLELLVGCNDTRIYCWDLGPGTYDPSSLVWGQWRHDALKTGAVPAHDPASIADPGLAGAIAGETAGLRAFPNPFSAATELRFRIAPGSAASVAIFDLQGRWIRGWDGVAPAGGGGTAQIDWDGSDAAGRAVPRGLYLVRIRSNGGTATGRLVRLP